MNQALGYNGSWFGQANGGAFSQQNVYGQQQDLSKYWDKQDNFLKGFQVYTCSYCRSNFKFVSEETLDKEAQEHYKICPEYIKQSNRKELDQMCASMGKDSVVTIVQKEGGEFKVHKDAESAAAYAKQQAHKEKCPVFLFKAVGCVQPKYEVDETVF